MEFDITSRAVNLSLRFDESPAVDWGEYQFDDNTPDRIGDLQVVLKNVGMLRGGGGFASLVAAEGVVGRVFIHFGEGGVVVAGVDEDGGGLAEQEGGEADVDEVGGLFAEHMDAEESHVVGVEEEFEEALLVADDEAAAVLSVEGAADDIGDFFLAEGFLAFAGAGALGDGVDAEREDAGEVGFVFEVEGVAHGDAALLHGGGGEGREADDIAGGVDVGEGGLEVFVDFEESAFVGFDADGFESEGGGVALATGGGEDGVEGMGAAVLEDGGEFFAGGEGLDFVGEAEVDAHPSHGGLEGEGDFGIEESEQAFASIDEQDLDAERGEDAGVFAADDAAADDEHFFGEFGDGENGIGLEEAGVVPGVVGGMVGASAGGDEEFCGGGGAGGAVGAGDEDGVGIEERAGALQDLDAVAVHVFADAFALEGADILEMAEEIPGVDALVEIELDSVEVALAEAGELEGGLAERFRGERAGVCGGTAGEAFFFDEGDFFAEICRLGGTFLACRAGTYDNEVVVHKGACFIRKGVCERKIARRKEKAPGWRAGAWDFWGTLNGTTGEGNQEIDRIMEGRGAEEDGGRIAED